MDCTSSDDHPCIARNVITEIRGCSALQHHSVYAGLAAVPQPWSMHVVDWDGAEVSQDTTTGDMHRY